MAILISSGIFLLMFVSNNPVALLSVFHPDPAEAAGWGFGLGFALPAVDAAGFFPLKVGAPGRPGRPGATFGRGLALAGLPAFFPYFPCPNLTTFGLFVNAKG